jgi:hypothetical protein
MCLPPFFRAYIFATLDPHALEFKANYDESYEKQYGFFHSVVDNVVHDCLKCGDLEGRLRQGPMHEHRLPQ